jgi:hypothetical protein
VFRVFQPLSGYTGDESGDLRRTGSPPEGECSQMKPTGQAERMNMKARFLTVVPVIMFSFFCTAANARVFNIDQEGVWTAFAGTADNGQRLCGISTDGTGKYFGLKYYDGDRTLTIQLGSKDWRIRDGGRQRVVLKMGYHSPWSAIATGFHFSDGDAGLQFEIRADQLVQFMNEFSSSDILYVRFPGSSVADWRGSLDGGKAISESLLRCIRQMRG